MGDTRAGGFLSIPPAYFPRGTMAEHQMKAKWRDPVFRASQSAAIRRGQSSKTFRRKRHLITRKLWKDPAFREKVTLALQEAQSRPEVSSKKSRSMKEYMANPLLQQPRINGVRPEPLSKFVQEWFGVGPYYDPGELNKEWD